MLPFIEQNIMKNYIESGDVLVVTAAAEINSGDVVITGSLIGVSVADAAVGEKVAVNLKGVYSLPKKAADTIDQGQAVYWDTTPGEVTETSTDNTLIGYAFAAAGGSTTTVQVKLIG